MTAAVNSVLAADNAAVVAYVSSAVNGDMAQAELCGSRRFSCSCTASSKPQVPPETNVALLPSTLNSVCVRKYQITTL